MNIINWQDRLGFTLLELVIVLSVVAMLTGVGMPHMTQFYARQLALVEADSFLQMLQQARIEAVQRQGYIVICPSLGHDECEKDWSLPIMVFNDKNLNKQKERNEELLMVQRVDSQLNINRNYLAFSPFLQASNVTATVNFCSTSGVPVKALIISNMGRIRTESRVDKINCQGL